jgi:hypothetical protein
MKMIMIFFMEARASMGDLQSIHRSLQQKQQQWECWYRMAVLVLSFRKQLNQPTRYHPRLSLDRHENFRREATMERPFFDKGRVKSPFFSSEAEIEEPQLFFRFDTRSFGYFAKRTEAFPATNACAKGLLLIPQFGRCFLAPNV